jgi:protein phosphatase
VKPARSRAVIWFLSLPKIYIPEPSLVLLVGVAGSGKSSFANKHFRPTEILSSDFCRGLVSDDESDQAATKDAFEVLRFIAAKRLSAGRLTVIDATNVQREARGFSLELARQFHIKPVAIVFDLPLDICAERNQNRRGRCVLPEIIEEQLRELRNSLPYLADEGFAHVYILSSPAEVECAVIERYSTR